ncbi:MAG: DNA polymerase III subunit epsilon [Gammaproteobacteria bacterium]|nr:DNA polymerase III subunit epsilon [Gammaproteobacteria bacterium]
MARQVVLDTETTGLEPAAGHRIIEIGCVELIDRRPTGRTFHRYLNPERAVEAGALEVHGIDDEFLAEQPRFADVVDEFLDFVRGAELVIHNADFDIEFINHELRLVGAAIRDVRECCTVLDTLALARQMHPAQRNSLDALAKRYNVDISMRELHGALLDARILADVYLAMTGGQVSLLLDAELEADRTEAVLAVRIARDGLVLPVLKATADEAAAHDAFLARIRQQCGGETVWDRIGAAASAAAASESTSPLDAPQKAAAGASAASDGRAAALGQSGEPALVPA